MELSERNKKTFLLNNASFMFIVCYIYAISFKHLFHLYLRLWKQKISTKLFLIPYTFSSVDCPLAKSGSLDFPSEKSFLLLFAHEKGLQNIFQK